ncbi:MAG: 3-hydroxyacyl-CoA dehydrogenase family protein [Candidatus Hermodarchaeota archaeon]
MINIDDLNGIAIIGAGTMGHGIAQVYAQAGFKVILVDTNLEILKHAMKLIESNLQVLAEFNKVGVNEIPSILSRIYTTTDFERAVEGKKFVLEAVSEIPEIKKHIFNQLAEICPNDAVLASNTSTLDIFKLLKDIKNQKRLITHHWFAPPHIIPLVEVAPSKKTSKEVINFSIELLQKIGKKPILINKFIPTYIVNKIQNAISGAMYELLTMKIATAEEIDFAIKSTLGIRLPIVGIVQSQDFTGLDLIYDIQKSMGGILPLIKEKVENNHLGAKTGKGFYEYNGKTEEEILKIRDRLYLQQLEFLEKTTNFKPI